MIHRAMKRFMSEKIYQTIQVVPIDDVLPIIERIEKQIRRQNSTPEIMNIKQIAVYLGVSEGTVRNRMKDGLPFTNKLGDPRFLKSEIDAWLKRKI